MRFEPRLALDGGQDGMGKIRQLSCQVGGKLRQGGSLLLEMGQGQSKTVTTFLHNLFPSAEIEVIPDLGGIERVICLSLANQLVSA
jgi:release factor glutamine methyltransferase